MRWVARYRLCNDKNVAISHAAPTAMPQKKKVGTPLARPARSNGLRRSSTLTQERGSQRTPIGHGKFDPDPKRWVNAPSWYWRVWIKSWELGRRWFILYVRLLPSFNPTQEMVLRNLLKLTLLLLFRLMVCYAYLSCPGNTVARL